MGVTETTSSITYQGNGATTAFAFNFRVLSTSDLKVIVRNNTTNVETAKTLTTHYTVVLNDGEGGTVTMLTAPASGETLYIGSNIDETQPESITVGKLPAATLEQMYDRLTLLIHQVRELTSRVPKFVRSTSSTNKTMAEPVNGSLLAWDASGNIVNVASLTSSPLLDEDDMVSDDDTMGATQQSIKAYVDARVASATITTKGDLLTRTSGALARLPVGSLGQVLAANNAESTGLKWEGRNFLRGSTIINASSPYSAAANDEVLNCSAAGGAITIDLPAAASSVSTLYIVRKTDSTTNTITIDGDGGENVGGSATQTLRLEGEAMAILCNGGSWDIIWRYFPPKRNDCFAYTAVGVGSTGTRILRFTSANTVTNGSAITYTSDATNGDSFTINEAGVYAARFQYQNTSGNREFGITLNQTSLSTNITANPISEVLAASSVRETNLVYECCVTTYLAAGSILRANTDSNTGESTAAGDCTFRVTKLTNV